VKNITITVDEEVARWARIWAARHDTSVSRLVGRVLRTLMQQERGYDAAMAQFFERSPVNFVHEGAYPSRDELHDR
jgi:plasmid stability protein